MAWVVCSLLNFLCHAWFTRQDDFCPTRRCAIRIQDPNSRPDKSGSAAKGMPTERMLATSRVRFLGGTKCRAVPCPLIGLFEVFEGHLRGRDQDRPSIHGYTAQESYAHLAWRLLQWDEVWLIIPFHCLSKQIDFIKLHSTSNAHNNACILLPFHSKLILFNPPYPPPSPTNTHSQSHSPPTSAHPSAPAVPAVSTVSSPVWFLIAAMLAF